MKIKNWTGGAHPFHPLDPPLVFSKEYLSFHIRKDDILKTKPKDMWT